MFANIYKNLLGEYSSILTAADFQGTLSKNICHLLFKIYGLDTEITGLFSDVEGYLCFLALQIHELINLNKIKQLKNKGH